MRRQWRVWARRRQVAAAEGRGADAIGHYREAVKHADAQGLAEVGDVPKIRLNLATALQSGSPADVGEADMHFRRLVTSASASGIAHLIYGAFLEGRSLPRAVDQYRHAVMLGRGAERRFARLRLGLALARHAFAVTPDALPCGDEVLP